jgi:hypothetical protein
MGSINLKAPEFLNLSEAEQKKIIEDIANTDLSAQQKQTALESMTFLADFQKKLKMSPNITVKQVRALLAAHVEKLKKLLLTQ